MGKILLVVLGFPLLAVALPREYLIGQGAYTIFHVVDWKQTLEIAENPQFYETNPVLGEQPSKGRVNTYFAATLVLHWTLGYILYEYVKPVWWVYIGFTSGVEGMMIYQNWEIGVRIKFR